MDERATVVVVGGGATGTAVARDLALRGVDVHLVERGPLAGGTSGHMHHLLHSGARYADTDAASARTCIAENRTVRAIAPHCVVDAGGLFVRHPDDPRDYLATKLAACRDAGIPVERLDGAGAREVEPAVAEAVDAALRVPDAVVDPFVLVAATAADAVAHGATVETDAAVTDCLVEAGEVVGVAVEREDATGTVRVGADHVVNAAGPWAGRVAGLADVAVAMRPARGAMAAVDLPALSTVVNRCRPRSAGDIAVPDRGTAILGTTDEPVDDPEDYPRPDEEVALIRAELSAVLPGVADADLVEAYWGVRPLYDRAADDGADPTDLSRDHVLLDHATRDGRPGLSTIVGGKLTTARAMGEAAADHVSDRLGIRATCRTADEQLVGADDAGAVEATLADAGVRLAAGRRRA